VAVEARSRSPRAPALEKELAQAFVDAAKRGAWRAAEAPVTRIYGKPEETVRQVDVNPVTAVLKSMSLEKKLQLLHRRRRGEPVARGRTSSADRIDPTPPPPSWRGMRSPRTAETRRMNALDWAAKLVEENGRELAESFLQAARNGEWRAAEALMNRIYGKPEQPLAVTQPEPSALLAFARSLRSMRSWSSCDGCRRRDRRDGTRAFGRRGCAAVRLAPPDPGSEFDVRSPRYSGSQ
jgi:hypothetical protein